MDIDGIIVEKLHCLKISQPLNPLVNGEELGDIRLSLQSLLGGV